MVRLQLNNQLFRTFLLLELDKQVFITSLPDQLSKQVHTSLFTSNNGFSLAIHLHILLDNLFRQKTLLPDWCISIRYFAIKGLPIEQLHHSAVFLRWVILSTASQHESTQTQGLYTRCICG